MGVKSGNQTLAALVAVLRYFEKFGRQIHSRFPRAEDLSMSIMVWKVMRRMPKPLLLVFLFFVLAAVARA